MKTETIQLMAGAAILSTFTYIPILARDYLSADEFYITILVGAYAAASFIASFLFGRAGDIYGRRKILKLGLFLSTLSFALILVSGSLEILFIVRVLNGFAIGIYPGALAAYAYESKMKMGKFASFGALGWGAGTLFAGYAAGFGIQYAFLVATIFFMIAFASAFGLPPIEHKPIRVPLFPIDTLRRNFSVYAAVLIRHSSAFAIWTLWPLFLYDLGADLLMIGVVQAMNAVAQVTFMTTIVDRFNCRKLIAMGLVASAITFLWFTIVTNVYEIIPAQILLGFSWACLYVGALKYVTEQNEERSTASGLLTSVLAISGVLGPIYAAVLWVLWGSYIPIFLFASLMSVLAFVVFLFSSRNDESITVPLEITIHEEEPSITGEE
ncbi:MAG: MFS transporter [Candidatus Thorarchaeota archaeon]